MDQSVNPRDYFGENIFVPWPDDDMKHWQVSKQLDYNGNGKELIEPVDNPVKVAGEGEQARLF